MILLLQHESQSTFKLLIVLFYGAILCKTKQTKNSICPPILVWLIPINYVFHLFWASRHEVCEGACGAFLVMLCELGDFYCAVLQSMVIFFNALASWSWDVYFPISIPNSFCFLGDAIQRLTLKTGNALCLQTDCLVFSLSDPRETFPEHPQTSLLLKINYPLSYSCPYHSNFYDALFSYLSVLKL